MLNLKDNFETFYDIDTKIWSGAKFKEYYDPNCSIGRILFEEMRRRPKHICQISDTENTRLTNAEVLLLAARISYFLYANGVRQGDVIGVAGRNTTYLMPVVLACIFSGIAYHAINPNHDKQASKLLFDITKPKIIFCDGQDYKKIKIASNDFHAKLITLKNHIQGVPNVLDLVQQPVTDEYKFEPAELENGADQTLAILCSSGSTGLPKAVTISNNCRVFEFTNYLTSEDIHFTVSTMDWYSGLLDLLSTIVYGSLRIIADKPFSPEYFLEIVDKYKVTFTINSPSYMAMLLNCSDLSVEKLDSMRYFLYGGTKSSTHAQQKMRSYLRNGKICFAYGFTEFGSIPTRNFEFEKKPNSVGRVRPGYKLKIINEEGVSLGHGEIGEICCYHGRRWNGYYNNTEATETMQDAGGWFHSGDLGYIDEDNYLFVVERKKDILKYHGMHYCPNDIELVIAQMPQVADVCVFGVWSELDSDSAAAAIVRSEGSTLTTQDVVNYVLEHIEVKYKQLNAGAIVMKEFPKTANGKVDRAAVKKIFLDSQGGGRN